MIVFKCELLLAASWEVSSFVLIATMWWKEGKKDALAMSSATTSLIWELNLNGLLLTCGTACLVVYATDSLMFNQTTMLFNNLKTSTVVLARMLIEIPLIVIATIIQSVAVYWLI